LFDRLAPSSVALSLARFGGHGISQLCRSPPAHPKSLAADLAIRLDFVAERGEEQKLGQDVWLLLWYCVTTTNPACMKWDGTTDMPVTSFNSEADCVSHAKQISRKVHSPLHFDLEYFCRKGVPIEPETPIRHASFQTETWGAAKRTK
jgi:hypothetical protein